MYEIGVDSEMEVHSEHPVKVNKELLFQGLHKIFKFQATQHAFHVSEPPETIFLPPDRPSSPGAITSQRRLTKSSLAKGNPK